MNFGRAKVRENKKAWIASTPDFRANVRRSNFWRGKTAHRDDARDGDEVVAPECPAF
jgi:hypothetical protein